MTQTVSSTVLFILSLERAGKGTDDALLCANDGLSAETL